jgi:hypothetical protein
MPSTSDDSLGLAAIISRAPPPYRWSATGRIGSNRVAEARAAKTSNVVRNRIAFSPLIAPFRSGAINRKLENRRLSTARNAQHRASIKATLLHNGIPLSNHSTSIQPKPPPAGKRQEVSVRTGIMLYGTEAVRAAVNTELIKIFDTHSAMRLMAHGDIEANALFLRSQMLIKMKSSGLLTARLPLDGSKQTADTYSDTYAGTSDSVNRIFLLSTAITSARIKGELDVLIVADFDVPAAFLNEGLPRSQTGGRQLYTRLPNDLPDERYAGKLAEVLGCMYGLRQSNSIFDKAFSDYLVSHGYEKLLSCDHTFVKYLDGYRIIVNMHVDDGLVISESTVLYDELKHILIKKYGPGMKFNDVSDGNCGIGFIRHDSGAISLNVSKYISKLLQSSGMDDVPPALTPSMPGLFDAPTNATPFDVKEYQRINGGLVWMLPVRFDIRKEVVHLCKANSSPTMSDRMKQIQVLRYLKGSPDIGPTYGSEEDIPESVCISAFVDAAHAVHTDGSSQSAYTISIGDNTVPFAVHAGAETSCVSPDAMGAEYIALGRCAKDVMFFRQFAEELRYPQLKASIIKEDNQSAINLTVSPAISKKSRHIFIRHHFIRDLFQRKYIKPVHCGTHDMIADVLTKFHGPASFLYFRRQLFGNQPIPIKY